MATAPVDLVREIYAEWARGDFSSVAWADPDIEYVHLGMEHEAGFVWTFQNGRIVRVAVFWSREEAFRAAGLEP